MLTWLETLAQDLRYGCRTLWRQRSFSVVAIGSVALGARWFDVVRMVMGLGLRLIAAGLLLGCLGALAVSRLLASQLWGVSPFDALSFAGVSVLLLVVGLVACFWPAQRAARVDPVVALRAE